MYKRLHHASVHEDALFKVLVHYFLPERQDLMCLLRDFVADQGRMPLPDIRRRSDNCPSFCRLQRKLVSPSDASSQYSRYGCASMSASKVNSALSSPGHSTQNPAQPRETFPLEKKGPHLWIPNISTDALQRNWNPITNEIRPKVAQKVELISSANVSAVDAHVVQRTAADSVKDRESSCRRARFLFPLINTGSIDLKHMLDCGSADGF